MIKSRQLGIRWLCIMSLLQRCQLSEYLGFLIYGRLLCYGSTATHGASKSIAIDGARADGNAEGRWRLLLSYFWYFVL